MSALSATHRESSDREIRRSIAFGISVSVTHVSGTTTRVKAWKTRTDKEIRLYHISYLPVAREILGARADALEKGFKAHCSTTPKTRRASAASISGIRVQSRKHARKSRVRRGHGDNLGRFTLVEPSRNIPVAGFRFNMSPEDVIDYFSE